MDRNDSYSSKYYHICYFVTCVHFMISVLVC